MSDPSVMRVREHRTSRWRRVAAVTAPLLAIGTTVAIASVPADAAATPNPVASAQFLTGQLPPLDLSTLTGNLPAAASLASATSSVPLSGSTLNSLPGAASLLGPSGILSLTDVNQVASVLPDGSALAGAGAVDSLGALTGSGGGLNLDATSLLSQFPSLGQALTGLSLSLSGIASTATQAADGTRSGSYQISGGVATLTSPLLALKNQLTTALAPVTAAITGLQGSNGGLIQALDALPVVDQVIAGLGVAPTQTATITADLPATLNSLLAAPLSSGGVSIDPVTGTLTADLATLSGGSLSGLPSGTNLLSPSILSTIASTVQTLIGGLATQIRTGITQAVDNAPFSLSSVGDNGLGGLLDTGMTITSTGTLSQLLDGTATASSVLTVLGLPLTLSNTDLLTALSTPVTSTLTGQGGALDGFTSLLPSSISGPLTTQLAPALSSLTSVLGLTAGNQTSANGLFTQLGAVLTLLPANPLAVLGLGSSTVGNAVAPTVTSLTPATGKLAGGTLVTLTGTGFVPNLTTATVDTTTVPAGAVSVASPTSLSFLTPSHAAGAVSISVTTPAGTSGPVSFTYAAPTGGGPTISTISPAVGSTRGGTLVSVTGSHFAAGNARVTIGGATVTPRVISSTKLRFRAPAHAKGSVTVQVSTRYGHTGTLPFRYVLTATRPVVRALTPNRVHVRHAATVVARGAHFVRGHTTVLIGGKAVPASRVHVVSALRLRVRVPARARAGLVRFVVRTRGGTSTPARLRFVR